VSIGIHSFSLTRALSTSAFLLERRGALLPTPQVITESESLQNIFNNHHRHVSPSKPRPLQGTCRPCSQTTAGKPINGWETPGEHIDHDPKDEQQCQRFRPFSLSTPELLHTLFLNLGQYYSAISLPPALNTASSAPY